MQPPKRKKGRQVKCILTGKINNITVFGFGDKNGYYKFIEKYPEFQAALAVKTSKGFHVYSKYNPTYETTTGKHKIDIRNDQAIVFGPGSKTELGTSYDWARWWMNLKWQMKRRKMMKVLRTSQNTLIV